MKDQRGSKRNKQLAWLFLLIGIFSLTDPFKYAVVAIFGTTFAPAFLMLGNLLLWVSFFMFIAYGLAKSREGNSESVKQDKPPKDQAEIKHESEKSRSFLTKEIKDLKASDFKKDIVLSSKTKRSLLISAVILTVLGVGIYWFVYRPYAVKKECSEQVREDYRQDRYVDFGDLALYETYFNACINKKGI